MLRVVLVLGLVYLLPPPLTAGELEDYAPRARMNFALYCAGCHQMSGKGAPGVVPDLGEYLGIFAQHPEARAFLVQVSGASSSPLDNSELAEVTNWILYTMNAKQLKPDFQPYTAEEVAEYRLSPLLDVIPVRDRLIEKILPEHGEEY